MPSSRSIRDLPVLEELEDANWGADFSWVADDLFRRDYQGLMRTSAGGLVVYRHADVAAFRSHPLVSHPTLEALTEPFRPHGDDTPFGMLSMMSDVSFGMRGARHAAAKKFQVQTMTPQAVGRFIGEVSDVVNSLIEQGCEREEIDFVTDFAKPLLVGLWQKTLGISEDEGREAIGLASQVFPAFRIAPTADQIRSANQAAEMWMETVPGWVRRAEQSGGYPFVQNLQDLHEDLDPETRPADPYRTIASAIFDGFETLGVLLSSIVHGMADAGIQPAGRTDGRAFGTAVFHEGSRLHSPFAFIPRAATEDFEHDGVLIPAETEINIMWLFANRDPNVFEEPLAFKPDRRTRGQEFAFGGGAYICAGRNLAKAVSELMVNQLVAESVVIEPSAEPAWVTGSLTHQLATLPVRMRRV